MEQKTQTVIAITGNGACTLAMKQIDPDVVAAYPITPQTPIMEEFSQYVADGVVNTELICVESEHSAMSASIGAAAAGARAITATAGPGLALMWEELYVAAGLRLPIVMHNVNRALSAPINIHCDHSDSMGARDSGWIQLYAENAQEVYDNTFIAVRVAEHADVRLPAMVMLDGFTISHAIDRIEVLSDDIARSFVGDFPAINPLLDVKNPVAVGAFDGIRGFYAEFKKAQDVEMTNALRVIDEVSEEYGNVSGRRYHHLERYNVDDAEIVLLVIGSSFGTIQEQVDAYRSRGMKVGAIKLRTFRPFPLDDLRDAIRNASVVGVFDRVVSVGAYGGPLFAEVRAALYDMDPRPNVAGFFYGLGGRDLELEHIDAALDHCTDIHDDKTLDRVFWIGLREKEA